MPESTPDFDALFGGLVSKADGADVNIAEVSQDIDSLKSIIAWLISKTSRKDRVIAEHLIEKDGIAVVHSIWQQRIAAAHATEQHETRDAHQAEQQETLANHAAGHVKLKAEFELRIQKIATAKANNQELSLWLTEVFSELPCAQTVEDYDRLLPSNVHPMDVAINPRP
jgi:hypothetical protein